MFFLEILIDYILPMIYSSLVSLILVLFILFIFRIKDSNIRILFFFIPLIKPFLVIAENIDIYTQQSKFSIGGFRLQDPNDFIRIFKNFERGPSILFNPNYLILLMITIGIIMILIIRWIILYCFYRYLAYEDKVERKEAPEIYDIIDNYSKKIKIKTPDVSLTHKKHLSPFIIGIKKTILVLSSSLLEKLNKDEKETLIQHELSHIKRKDNLIGWIALVLRDLLFFNPFAYIAYNLIRSEQEKDSDKLVVKYSDKPQKEVAKNILNIILKIRSISTSKSLPQPIQGFQFMPFSFFNQIKLKNRINSILKTSSPRIYSRIFPRILMYITFLVLLLIQFLVVIKITNFYIVLR